MTGEEFARRIEGMVQTLYKVCYAQLARACDREDAVQNALEKAWRCRERLREEQHMQTWLIRIAINECHNLQRRMKRECLAGEMEERSAPEGEDGALHDALLRLPEKHRMPLLLHYMEGYSVAEVATILKLPQGTIKSRMRRGRMQLREELGREVMDDAK